MAKMLKQGIRFLDIGESDDVFTTQSKEYKKEHQVEWLCLLGTSEAVYIL